MGVNTMVYFCVDENGDEFVCGEVPARVTDKVAGPNAYWSGPDYICPLPTGTIKKITGKEITWSDEPLLYVGENYDPSPDTQPSEQ